VNKRLSELDEALFINIHETEGPLEKQISLVVFELPVRGRFRYSVRITSSYIYRTFWS